MIKEWKRLKWVWLDRIALVRRIRKLDRSKKAKIVLGAGNTNYSDWISTDYPVFNILSWWQWALMFRKNSIDNLLLEHVLEHFTVTNVRKFLRIAYPYLKEGGTMRIAVPDQYHSDPQYVDMVKPGGYGIGSDDHKSFWSQDSLSSLAQDVGYECFVVEAWTQDGHFNSINYSDVNGIVTRRAIKYEEIEYTSLIVDLVK